MADTLFEACVESVAEARAAAAGGADRLELCIDLAHDGRTPPASLVVSCLEAVTIPIIAMVRPRRGDFVYSRLEVGAMYDAVEELGALPVAGFATGALLPDGTIDRPATKQLISAAGGRPVTFHRAFDRVPDVNEGLDALIALGVARVLTSGASPTAESGLEVLRALVERSAGRIEVIAAGGVRPFNVERVIAATGAPAFHARWSGWWHADGGTRGGQGGSAKPAPASR